MYAGQWTSFEERQTDTAAIHEICGIKYAFLSYSQWTNGHEIPSGKEYLLNVYSDEKAREDINLVKDKADIIIVAMHWGREYDHGVLKEQERIANHLSNLGVSLVIGSHPHVVEPLEYINNNKTFVIYSLGNLLTGQIGVQRNTGLLMSVDIIKETDESGNVSVRVENPCAELVFNKYDPEGKRNQRVYPYSLLTNDIFEGYEDELKPYKEIVSSRYPDLKWGITC